MDPFPEFMRKLLPKADIKLSGIEGWIAQGSNFQILFLDIASSAKVTPHSHGEQFGLVIEGEMTLTIGSETRTYRKGDMYHIPKGVEHFAEFHTRVKALDFFEDKDRYSAKKE